MIRRILLGAGITLIILAILLSVSNLELINLANLKEQELISLVEDRGLVEELIAEQRVEIEEAAREDFAWQEEVEEDYVIKEASNLGMVFPEFNLIELIAKERINKIEESEGLKYKNLFFLPQNINDESWLEISQAVVAGIKASETEDEPLKEQDSLDESELEMISFEISSGMQGREVAWLLAEKGLVDDASSFILLMNRFGVEDQIKAGSYQVESGISAVELLLEII